MKNADVDPEVYSTLEQTFKVNSSVKPNVYYSSQRLHDLTRPKLGHNFRRVDPYRNQDFRGLLHSDYQDTVQKIQSSIRVQSKAGRNTAADDMKIENGVLSTKDGKAVTQTSAIKKKEDDLVLSDEETQSMLKKKGLLSAEKLNEERQMIQTPMTFVEDPMRKSYGGQSSDPYDTHKFMGQANQSTAFDPVRCSQQTNQILKRPLTAFMRASMRQSQESSKLKGIGMTATTGFNLGS